MACFTGRVACSFCRSVGNDREVKKTTASIEMLFRVAGSGGSRPKKQRTGWDVDPHGKEPVLFGDMSWHNVTNVGSATRPLPKLLC